LVQQRYVAKTLTKTGPSRQNPRPCSKFQNEA
jgi:hypothetical protein